MTVSKSQLMERKQWRSLAALARDPEARAWEDNEFAPGASEVEMTGLSRRKFLGVMGASMAVAGVTATGCRKPVEYILPYDQRPEDLVPGQPRFFRTVAQIGPGVLGLHVEAQENRPTKIEGNADHPMNNPKGVLRWGGGGRYGATNAWAQAAILDLYDTDRSREPRREGLPADWDELFSFLQSRFQRPEVGGGLALLVESRPSPSLRRILSDLARVYPDARIFAHDAVSDTPVRQGAALVGAGGRRVVYELDEADVVLALDADIFGTEGDVVRNSALFTSRRRLESESDGMNRLYVVEPVMTVTGLSADNRLRLAGTSVGEYARALALAVLAEETALPYALRARIGGSADNDRFGAWIDAVAADLGDHRGRSAVIVGQRQPAWMHALGHLLNDALGNIGSTVQYIEDGTRQHGTITELASAIEEGQVETLVLVGGNPVYTAPADLDFGSLLSRVDASIHLSSHFDETSQGATWHVPTSHFLESWGDLTATDGTSSIQQPLIAPLHGTRSELDLLARIILAGGRGGLPETIQTATPETDLAHELVRDTGLRAGSGDFEASWRRWLHDGIVAGRPARVGRPNFNWDGLMQILEGVESTGPGVGNLEVDFYPDYATYDGRWANNAWLQEMPDPLTKLTWDNVASISPATARQLRVESGDLVELELDGRSIEIPALVVPGTADHVVGVTLGYGRRMGAVAEGVGVDVYPLRTTEAPFIGLGASLRRTGRSQALATTQHHHSMRPREGFPERPLVRIASYEENRTNPHWVDEMEVLDEEHRFNLFGESPFTYDQGHAWAMTIDLTACTGCSACVIACQSENSIPVVTKERVLKGREMHWIRIDRYYTGDDENDPGAVAQPIPCMQCENAPCETVCPVGATVHSPEGLNDMAYNRCIGTRYCLNNCPYKVRRFNFFNYGTENNEKFPLQRLQRNPDVTVRFRGVMEKCTYCVQRINQAKIANHREGRDRVPDGQIITACAQACPTRAIVFGDKNDPDALVVRTRGEDRNYELLGELNNRPRTTYLAKIRNPNPALV